MRISGKTLNRFALAGCLVLVGLAGCGSRNAACKTDKECSAEDRCIEKVCGGEFTKAVTLAGKKKKVPAAWLNAGRESYMLHCRPCHGAKGKGDGPASFALRPPPRDLSIATYKFAGVVEGLPHDSDFTRMLHGGLSGTAMLPWDLPKDDLYAITQYIKTFAPPGEAWLDPEAKLGEQVVPPPDPWKDKKEALAHGKAIYHTVATCQSCHPAYATRAEIYTMSLAMKAAGQRKDVINTFRKDMYQPEAKESTAFEAGGVKMRILPPDFLYNVVRTLSPRRPNDKLQDIYRLIGSGIPGTAMPAWKGAMPDKDIWALTHYVVSIIELKDTTAGAELVAKLAADTGDFVPPAEAAPAAPAPAAPGAAPAPAAAPAAPAPAAPAGAH